MKIIRILLLLIFISMVAISSYYLLDYYNKYKKDEAVVDNLKTMIIENNEDDKSIDINIHKDYSNLYTANKDFIGWLKIDDTHIDYPVMQSDYDEQFYLKRNFHKEYSDAGTLFCSIKSDIKTPSSNIIIHGHNMNSGAMFHDLLKYEDEDFYKSHKYITFDTLYNYGTYEVVAAFRTDVNKGSYAYYNFTDGDEEQFNKYINFAMKRTPYNMDSNVKYGDKLITLSTCAYHVKNGRYVVIAKLVENDE